MAEKKPVATTAAAAAASTATTPPAPGGSAAKRAGMRVEGLPQFGIADVAKHNTPETRIWVVYREAVYDITDFIEGHPGGTQKIMQAAGSRIDPFWRLYQQHGQEFVLEVHVFSASSCVLLHFSICNVGNNSCSRAIALAIWTQRTNFPKWMQRMRTRTIRRATRRWLCRAPSRSMRNCQQTSWRRTGSRLTSSSL